MYDILATNVSTNSETDESDGIHRGEDSKCRLENNFLKGCKAA